MSKKIEELREELRRLKKERDNFDVSEYADDEDYADWIDEIEGEVIICGMSYSASNILREVDPTAYRCIFSDYCDGLEKEDFKEYEDILEKIEEIEGDIEELEEEEDV
jgi:Rad3-related DNA helicase